jgi:hypothetical protein
MLRAPSEAVPEAQDASRGDRRPDDRHTQEQATHRQVADAVASDEPATIVTAKNPRRRDRFGDVPDMTPEEHKQRGDAADELFRRMKREIAASPVPRRHWRSYGTEPLPTPTEALEEPFSAFPSWFMRITCDRCGKDRMLSETHATAAQRDLPLRDIIARMRHDRCGGRAGKVELMTGIDGASSRPVWKIVLRAE